MEYVGNLDWQLEKANVCTSLYPTYLAWEENDAESEDSAECGDDVVEFIIANVCDENQRGWYQYAHECRRLVVGCRDAPPPFVAWVIGYASGEKGKPRKDNTEDSA